MSGSLDLHEGVLYVGTEVRAAEVRAFDLDGRELAVVARFAGDAHGAAAASGLAVDDDHRLWIADSIGERLLAFNLFGKRMADVSETALATRGRAGELGTPVDVVTTGTDDDQRLWVASSGTRRHAVRSLPLGSGAPSSLRPGGDPDALFHGVRGLARGGDYLYVSEATAGRVQVFRSERFHFAFEAGSSGPADFFPVAAAAVGDGRVLVVHGAVDGALLLFDAAGRLLRVLAGGGVDEGQLCAPNDVAIEVGADDRHARIAVIDRDGTRVQVFNLEGSCYGSFPDFAPGEASSAE